MKTELKFMFLFINLCNVVQSHRSITQHDWCSRTSAAHSSVANCICTQCLPLLFRSLRPCKTTKGSSHHCGGTMHVCLAGKKASLQLISMDNTVHPDGELFSWAGPALFAAQGSCLPELIKCSRQLERIGLLANLNRLIIISEAPSESGTYCWRENYFAGRLE